MVLASSTNNKKNIRVNAVAKNIKNEVLPWAHLEERGTSLRIR